MSLGLRCVPPLGGAFGNLRIPRVFRWVHPTGTLGKPHCFPMLSRGAPWGDIRKTSGLMYFFAGCSLVGHEDETLSFRWVPTGETTGNVSIPVSFRWVPTGRPEENQRISLGFRLVPQGGTSGKPKDFLWFSLGTPKGDLGKPLISLRFRWVLPGRTSGKPTEFVRFSPGAPGGKHKKA